jgi:hypothetical protein
LYRQISGAFVFNLLTGSMILANTGGRERALASSDGRSNAKADGLIRYCHSASLGCIAFLLRHSQAVRREAVRIQKCGSDDTHAIATQSDLCRTVSSASDTFQLW